MTDPAGAPRRGTARDLLAAEPDQVAPSLLGARLVSDLGARVVVRITEVEAYAGVGEDPGSHAHRGRTPRNGAMFGPVGHAYVYLSYGMHWCVNIVAHPPGRAGAVLIRAGQVVTGSPSARDRRPTARVDADLARGPARLAACLGITGAQDGTNLLDPTSALRLEWDPAGVSRPGPEVSAGPRTGVGGAGARTSWRFWLPGEPTVSRYRAARPRPRP